MKLEPLRFDLRVHPERIARALSLAVHMETPWWSSVVYTTYPVGSGVNPRFRQFCQPCCGGLMKFTVEEKDYRLDYDALQRAVQLVADRAPWIFGELLSEDYEPRSAANKFLQYALFGEVRYP